MVDKKKTKSSKVGDDMDFGDLEDMGLDEDMEFGDEAGLDSGGRKPSATDVAKDLSKEASKGFFDSVLKETAKKSLPEAYISNYSELSDYADFTKETFDRSKNKLNKSLYRAGKEVKKILPFHFKALDSYLEKYESDFETFKQQTQEQMQDASTSSAISSIFDKQLEVQKALVAKSDSEDNVRHKETIAINKVNLDTLTSIDNNVANQTAFTLQISKEYFKKSLELQFKSYYIQADQLKTMRDYYKGFSIQFDSIAKNTSLPEFVKLKNTERLQEIMRTQMVESTYKTMFSNSKYIEGVKKKVGQLVDEKIGSITDIIDNVTGQLEMMNSAGEMGGGGGSILASALSGMLGSTLGEKVAGKISPKIMDKIKDNKTINAGGNFLSTLSTSPSTLFGDLRDRAAKKTEEMEGKDTPTGWLGSKLFGGLTQILGATTPDKINTEVKGQSILTHGQPAIFDNKVHRSITEIIPMYLSKILKENSDVNKLQQLIFNDSRRNLEKIDDRAKKYERRKNGKTTIVEEKKSELPQFNASEEMHYDYENRTFVNKADLITNVQKSVFKGRGRDTKAKRVGSTILSRSSNELDKVDKSQMSKDEKAKANIEIKLLKNKETQALLEDYLSKASDQSDINFDYTTLIENHEKATGSLKEILDRSPELVHILGLIKKSKVDKVDKTLDSSMKDVKEDYPITAVKELFKAVSMIAGRKIYNSIKDSNALIVAKALTVYITQGCNNSGGEDILPTTLGNGKCFCRLTKEDVLKVQDNIKVLISDVKLINDSGDLLLQSSLLGYITLVNKSLKDNINIDPSVFQTLHEYNPMFVKKGQLSTENFVEGILGNFKDPDYIDSDDLRSLTRTKKNENDQIRNRITQDTIPSGMDNFFNGVKKRQDKFKADLAAAGTNPKALFGVLTNTLKEAKDGIESVAKSAYTKSTQKLSELSKLVDDITQKGANKALPVVIGKLSDISRDLKARIDGENESRRKLIDAVTTTHAAAAESLDISNLDGKTEKEIKMINRVADAKIMVLKTLLKDIDITQVKLNGYAPDGNVTIDTTELFLTLKGSVSTLVKRSKDALEKYSQDTMDVT